MDAKRALYGFVNDYRQHYSSVLGKYSVQDFCDKVLNMQVSELAIRTPGLRALAFPETEERVATIILNSNRTLVEQSFDCYHELVHLTKHGKDKAMEFTCFEDAQSIQDSYLEWEANEGAAEFLMPYKAFIPATVARIAFIEDDYIRMLPEYVWELADQFHVTSQMVQLRISNLRYETLQYLSGISLDDLDIRSNSSQKRAGIDYSQIIIKPWYKIPRVYNGPVLGCCSNFWY